jgi:hypothetical protein
MAKHPFLEMYSDTELAGRLRRFYESGEVAAYQHKSLAGTAYMPDPMVVDFEVIDNLENPDFTDETIGEDYIEFANLLLDPETDPEGYECYAHLAIHPVTTAVYLVEPSGEPEHIADDLDGLLARLGE